MEVYYVFESTHAVILAEKALLAAGQSVKVRPVPDQIKAGCGLCLCCKIDRRHAAESVMQDCSLSFTAYALTTDGFALLEK